MKTILFDLDGTLTNSQKGVLNGMRDALRKMGDADVAEQDLIWCIGPPLNENMGNLLSDPTEENVQQACNLYHEYYREQGFKETELYPGVVEMLRTLHAEGAKLYIATSKAEYHAKNILAHFELDHLFAGIHGSTLDGSRSKKVDIISYVCDSHDFDPAHAIMIGDHKVDVLGGKHHGMRTIAVTYGYGSNDELNSANPDVFCYDSEKLLSTIELMS